MLIFWHFLRFLFIFKYFISLLYDFLRYWSYCEKLETLISIWYYWSFLLKFYFHSWICQYFWCNRKYNVQKKSIPSNAVESQPYETSHTLLSQISSALPCEVPCLRPLTALPDILFGTFLTNFYFFQISFPLSNGVKWKRTTMLTI